MDLLTVNRSTFQVEDVVVQERESCIWTERYQQPGSFEIVTSDILRARAELPVGTLVSLRDSFEVMMVETHEIVEDSETGDNLKVIGRSLTAFLEERVTAVFGPGIEKDERFVLEPSCTPTEAAAYYMWSTLVNTSVNSIWIRVSASAPNYTGYWKTDNSPLNVVPNLLVTETLVADIGPREWVEYEPGVISEPVHRLLKKSKCGIRAMRAGTSGGNAISFLTPDDVIPETGMIIKTPVSNTPALRLDLYNGYDRRDTVIFHTEVGDLDDTSFVSSILGHKNSSYVTGVLGAYDNTYGVYSDIGAPSGLDRRQIHIAAGSRPPEVLIPAGIEEFRQAGLFELSNLKSLFMFDGQIPKDVGQGYGISYGLGDQVTIMGKYGISGPMFVSEYIRTEDEFGETGYPTLAQL